MTRKNFLTYFSGHVISFYSTNSGQAKLHEIQDSEDFSGHATHYMTFNNSRKPFYHPALFWVQMVFDARTAHLDTLLSAALGTLERL